MVVSDFEVSSHSGDVGAFIQAADRGVKVVASELLRVESGGGGGGGEGEVVVGAG